MCIVWVSSYFGTGCKAGCVFELFRYYILTAILAQSPQLPLLHVYRNIIFNKFLLPSCFWTCSWSQANVKIFTHSTQSTDLHCIIGWQRGHAHTQVISGLMISMRDFDYTRIITLASNNLIIIYYVLDNRYLVINLWTSSAATFPWLLSFALTYGQTDLQSHSLRWEINHLSKVYFHMIIGLPQNDAYLIHLQIAYYIENCT